ncbi:hypothetical protein K0M31_011784 [Melipona bicolor]|uniref:Uncharacterized protein n=1 Tax=Melipona bicolor TaxID=60889 RepID=A0AA40KVC3_9HYME|nr:hypothetical protein K0M31_011784 [Melipona bicolor]
MHKVTMSLRYPKIVLWEKYELKNRQTTRLGYEGETTDKNTSSLRATRENTSVYLPSWNTPSQGVDYARENHKNP